MTHPELVDPELLPALEFAPSFGDMTDTLQEVRAALTGATMPAPEAPGTTVEEVFTPVRVLLYSTDATTKPNGCLLWFHGGGMVMGTPEQNDPLCRYLAKTTGALVVAVNYRLAPENPYPAAVEDAYTALRWCHDNADKLGFPRDRIAVAGESGGGGVAAALTLLARDRGELPVSAQFLLYPMLDDRTGTSAEHEPIGHTGEFVWTRASNRFAWHAVLGKAAGGADVPAHAAPGRAEELAGLPETAIFIGELDLFIGENLRYAGRLVRDGVRTALHVYPGAYHAFISFAQDADVSRRGFRDFRDALVRHYLEKR
jgi:triacylglycerol lipase